MKLERALSPIAAALVPSALDYQFAREAEELEIRLIDDGLCGFVIDAFLADHHDKFVARRRARNRLSRFLVRRIINWRSKWRGGAEQVH